MKRVAIISKGRNTCISVQEQLENFIGNQVSISGYLCTEITQSIDADLAVFSSKEAYADGHIYISPQCPAIVARRSINYHEIDQLLDLPTNIDVLLVSDLLIAAQETILLLQTLGFDHIHYHPYVPGLRDYPRLKIAVTPGEVGLVPGFVEKIIDIKSRLIDITTVVEILYNLSILNEKANLLSANYARNIIDLIKKNKLSTNISNDTKTQLQTIIDTVHDGVIAVDDRKCITVFNPVAGKYLGLDTNELLGKTITSVNNQNIIEIFNDQNYKKETFIRMNNYHLIVNIAEIRKSDQNSGMVVTLKDVSEIQRLEEELRIKTARQLYVARYTLEQTLGKSEIIKKTVELARKIASSNAPILIQGESGTGKELIAQGIHNASPRKNGPFIAINFAALSENLLESELFGYEEGAFTGARKGGSPGLFEQAHRGTFFLDEIGDAPLSFQVRILRVLQEKQVRRIGGARLIPIDVRIITATNRDLEELIAKGSFRQDLYYRLNVLPIAMPALRHRKTDIITLAQSFYDRYFCNHKPVISAEAYFGLITPHFIAYDWPGNIRELQNIVEYLVNICSDGIPTPEMLPKTLRKGNTTQGKPIDQDGDVFRRILREIKQHNKYGKPVGRRSLSTSLDLPESLIRKSISILEKKGVLIIGKGKKGLSIADNAKLDNFEL